MKRVVRPGILSLLATMLLLGCSNDVSDAYLHFKEGQEAFEAKKYAEAIQHLTRAIENDSTCFKCFELRAESYEALGHDSLQLEDLEHLIVLKPEQFLPWYLRAQYYLERKKYRKALEDFDEAMRLVEEPFAEIFLLRSRAYTGVGDLEAAREDSLRSTIL